MLEIIVHFIYELFLNGHMRSVLIAFILMAITIPNVHAVGIATMIDYSGGFEMTEGDQIDLDFSLRGDNVDNTVTFFIYSEADGVRFDGENRYEVEFHLNEYEDEDIEIEMEAWRPGNWDVTYGYRQGGEDGGFDIESYVENTFVVEVEDRDDYDVDDFDVVVNSTQEDSGSGGSSGGGRRGGAYVPPIDNDKIFDKYGFWYDEEGNAFDGLNNPVDAAKVAELKAADEFVEDVIIADVSTQSSALTEGVVDIVDSINKDSPGPSQLLGLSVDDEGKNILAVVLVLGALAMIFTFGAAKYVGRDD